jgi:hypothetical protein
VSGRAFAPERSSRLCIGSRALLHPQVPALLSATRTAEAMIELSPMRSQAAGRREHKIDRPQLATTECEKDDRSLEIRAVETVTHVSSRTCARTSSSITSTSWTLATTPRRILGARPI